MLPPSQLSIHLHIITIQIANNVSALPESCKTVICSHLILLTQLLCMAIASYLHSWGWQVVVNHPPALSCHALSSHFNSSYCCLIDICNLSCQSPIKLSMYIHASTCSSTLPEHRDLWRWDCSVSQNVSKKLPIAVVQDPRRAKISTTLWWKPKTLQVWNKQQINYNVDKKKWISYFICK